MGFAARGRMGRYWDARAREDPYYYVANTVDYGGEGDDSFWASGAADLARITSELGVSIAPPDRVLEIGCGVGRMTRAIAERAAQVRALDVSAEMLEVARRRNPQAPNVEWILGDGATLAPVPGASVDAVLSFVVFQHIPDPNVTLGYVAEIARVLAPGGWAAFQVSNDPRAHAKRPLRTRTAEFARALTSPRRLAAAARGHLPYGWSHPAWRGSAIDLAQLERTAVGAGAEVARVANPGTQFCLVLLRRPGGGS